MSVVEDNGKLIWGIGFNGSCVNIGMINCDCHQSSRALNYYLIDKLVVNLLDCIFVANVDLKFLQRFLQ
jgi:hypothetical protein